MIMIREALTGLVRGITGLVNDNIQTSINKTMRATTKLTTVGMHEKENKYINQEKEREKR